MYFCFFFLFFFFFFNDTATTEIYTLSLHDALPISCRTPRPQCRPARDRARHRHLHHGGPGHVRHAVRPGGTPARAHRRQHPRRPGRRTGPRPHRRPPAQAQRRPGSARPRTLRRRQAHRPADRRDLRRAPLHRLRIPRQDPRRPARRPGRTQGCIMSTRATRPPSYLTRLLAELDQIHADYAELLSASAIRNIDPGPRFIGFPSWGWADSSAGLEASRMALLRLVRGWEPRFRMLFPHATPTVSERLDEHLGRLERWLVRKPGEHGIPSTIGKAAEQISADVADLRELARLLPPDEHAVRLAVDTNTLIGNPDLAAHVGMLGRRYMAHLLPVVLREIDDLK